MPETPAIDRSDDVVAAVQKLRARLTELLPPDPRHIVEVIRGEAGRSYLLEVSDQELRVLAHALLNALAFDRVMRGTGPL